MNPLKAKIALLESKLVTEDATLKASSEELKSKLLSPGGLTLVLGTSFLVGLVAAKKSPSVNSSFLQRLVEAGLVANRLYKQFQ